MIRNNQVCLVVSGGSATSSVTSVVLKAAGEETDEYKCELVSCNTQWNDSSSVIFKTEVSQANVLTKAYLWRAHATLSPSTPNDKGQETAGTIEMQQHSRQ